ncbi:Tim44 domain-containing protein [Thiomicrorhabdus sp. Kp2]|uniref:Tim44 domain-containing protein n=1 Tax=Thiomicrorhabdus sp. Kp2 TaxID=1123518 RepID=UPI00041F525E|nr:Tim44-like domain-containing protein [Thiomicrorhabdus sp. Kp2]
MKSLFTIKPSFIVLFTLMFGLFSVAQVAEAKRFGAGKSFGYSKQVAPKQYNTPPKAAPAKPAANTATAGKPVSGASKWLGPLAGLAAGGLLAAMLFGDGFDGLQLFDILLFALIAFVLFKLFARKAQGRSQQEYQPVYSEPEPSHQASYRSEQNAYRQANEPASSNSTSSNTGSIIGADLEDGVGQGVSENAQFLNEIPAWFDEHGFVEGAKSHFITLQKAWDNVDLSEMESYCTPELFSALQQELRGVQAGDNQTVVDTLDAEVAAMAVDGEYFIVSVRFSGFIQEEAVKGAHAFNEIWHIRRLANDEGNWQVAGIQQTNGSL